MFGLLMRHCSWPLAIMLSADRVPVKSTRFKWRSGTCGLSRSVGRLAWVRYAIIALSNLVAREAVPRVLAEVRLTLGHVEQGQKTANRRNQLACPWQKATDKIGERAGLTKGRDSTWRDPSMSEAA